MTVWISRWFEALGAAACDRGGPAYEWASLRGAVLLRCEYAGGSEETLLGQEGLGTRPENLMIVELVVLAVEERREQKN